MDDSIRVMVERGKKKRVVACAFDWSGWDRSAKTEEDALRVLAAYRPRYAKVAALAASPTSSTRPVSPSSSNGSRATA
jgi:hypothetical protein